MTVKQILIYLLAWRIVLFAILFLAISTIPLQLNFLGGGFSNYLEAPYLWAWANYDGEHYIFIARSGYQSLKYFFFPLYPILIEQITGFLKGDYLSYLYSALFVSHLAFVIGIIGVIKLIKLDFTEAVTKIALILLLIFPTSFYFGSAYTESLFFALVVWSFYFARKEIWILAGILGGFATATRITGLALFPALIAEYILVNKVDSFKKFISIGVKRIAIDSFSIFLVLAGIIGYMIFLEKRTGDPLVFFHNLNSVYGEHRGSTLIILPQVFYRYFFKIIPNLNFDYFPTVFMTMLEISTALVFLFLIVLLFLKFRLSYSIFSLLAYLLPTFSGSFSSLPRYVLIIFPAFIAASFYISKMSNIVRLTIYLILFVGLLISTSLFVRGFWLA